MGYEPTVFNQLFNFIPRHVFDKSVRRLAADRYTKRFSAWQQFLLLLYAQASGKQTLREITGGLQVNSSRLYHLGLKPIARSTIADGLARRNSILFETLFYELVRRTAGQAPKHPFRFKHPLYSIDATTIDLCLSVFDWAKFRTQKGAIKLHCQLDHSGQIPSFAHISDGKTSDIKAAKEFFRIMPDSIYCFDKGYIDFKWLYSIEKQEAFFVTRAKCNLDFRVTGQHGAGGQKGVISDQIIELNGCNTALKYPVPLRMITYQDETTGKIYQFITNHFRLAASTVALRASFEKSEVLA